MAQYFNGQTVVAPQVVVATDDSAMGSTPGVTGSANVAIIGPATKGQPKTPIKLTSFADALRIFGSTGRL
jgi:hypothetical protein